MGQQYVSVPIQFDRLRADIAGQVIAPEDPEYDAARVIPYGGFEHRRPAVIVRVASAADVERVVALAHETGLELAVRAGGHSLAAFGLLDGGIVIDVSRMKGIEIDAASGTVWAEAGVTAGELTKATGELGLAVPFGDTGSVGIAGITLGGGVGYLVRKYGLTIDSLLAAEVVTADGRRVLASASSEPDLFWAIRGGGGNFGVVTRLQYRLRDVSSVTGGMLLLPATPDVVEGIVAAADAAPRELSAIVNVMPAPPMPFIPEDQRGRLVVMALLAYVGDAAAAAEALAPFRALAQPIADMVRPLAYPELFPPEAGGDFHPAVVAHTTFADRIDRAAAMTAVDRLESSTASMRVVTFRILGGAASEVAADATAYAHRAERIMVVVGSFYDGTAADRAGRQEWADELGARLGRPGAGAYVNFIGDEGDERVRAAYPGATWDRLVEVKRRYDPENLFRHNQNVRP